MSRSGFEPDTSRTQVQIITVHLTVRVIDCVIGTKRKKIFHVLLPSFILS
jgi:hypothetical protein